MVSGWVVPEPDDVDGPGTGPERPILEAYLDFQRRTFMNVCAGLTAEQLALRPLTSTNLTLLGLLRHLAKVERLWFRMRVAGDDVPLLYDTELGQDRDFDEIDPAQARLAYETYRDEVRLARLAAVDADFDDVVSWRMGPWSVRMIHVHMIGEYARHNGHADLLRQAIDGASGR